jgi:hypothetical protein
VRQQFNERRIDDLLWIELNQRRNDNPRVIIQEEYELIRLRDEEDEVSEIIARQDVVMDEVIVQIEAQQQREAVELALLQEQDDKAELESAQRAGGIERHC